MLGYCLPNMSSSNSLNWLLTPLRNIASIIERMKAVTDRISTKHRPNCMLSNTWGTMASLNYSTKPLGHVGGILSVIKRWVKLQKAERSYARVRYQTVYNSLHISLHTYVSLRHSNETALYTSNMAAVTTLGRMRLPSLYVYSDGNCQNATLILPDLIWSDCD